MQEQQEKQVFVEHTTEQPKMKTKQESKLSKLKNVNWFGLAGGILLTAVIYFSFSNPWWLFQVGDFVSANVTPFNTNFSLLGMSFMIPLLTAVNISSLLMPSC